MSDGPRIVVAEPVELVDALGAPLFQTHPLSGGTFSNVPDAKPLTAEMLQDAIKRLNELRDAPMRDPFPVPISPREFAKLRDWNCIDAGGRWLPESQWRIPDDERTRGAARAVP